MMEDKNSQSIINILEDLKNAILKLDKKVSDQNKKIKVIEEEVSALRGVAKVKTYQPAAAMFSAPTPPPPPPPASITAGEEEAEEEVKTEEKVEKKKEAMDLEEKIGGRWFAKIGIAVLIIGVSFFLKYAFDQNWINPTMRVIMGLAAGLVLLVIGEKTIRKYANYGQIISGGGIALLYLSIFSAFNFYHLIMDLTAFLFMALVTLVGIMLSLRYNALSLMMASIIGGFATPFLISSGVNHQIPLFIYITLLDLAILIVSFFKNWRALSITGMTGTLIVFSSWFDNFYTKDQLASTMFFLTIFFLIYSVSSFIYNVVNKEKSGGAEQVMTLLSAFIYFAVSYNLLKPEYDGALGIFALLLAIYYFIWAYAVKAATPNDDRLYNFLAFLSIGFITLAVPLQFDKFVITIIWTIEGVLISLVGSRIKGRGGLIIKALGLGVFMMAIIRTLALDQIEYTKKSALLLNKVFLSSLFAIIGSYLIAFFYKYASFDEKDPQALETNKKVIAIFIFVASFLTVFSASRDINQHFNNKIDAEYARVSQYNNKIINKYGNYQEYQQTVDQSIIKGLRETSQLSISLFFLIYGVIILAIGVFIKYRVLIAGGAALNILVAFSLLSALWEMDTYARSLIAGCAIVTAYITAGLLKAYKSIAGGEDKFIKPAIAFTVFIVIANILSILWISREIVVYYDKQINIVNAQIQEKCDTGFINKFNSIKQYDSIACQAVREKIKKLENKASTSISIYWLIYSIILVAIGFAKRYKWVRIGGILLLMVAILKLFFYDLWSLGQLYRIIASISLGVVLLGISFAYQKYKHVFKEIIQ